MAAMRRMCVVTAGHLATCPRMLKAADALAGAGYVVRVISVSHTSWAADADRAVFASRPWKWTAIDNRPETERLRNAGTGIRFKAAHAIARVIGPSRVPVSMAIRAYSRLHDEIVRAVTAEPADCVYGGTTGALAAVAESAARLGVPYGIDFEDFHSGEHAGPGAELANGLAARIERHVIADAAFRTAGSPMIADAYHRAYGVRPTPIHNTFSVCVPETDFDRKDGALRLYWFSQTLGPDRGLENVVRACGNAGVPIELHLRARASRASAGTLSSLQRAVAPRLTIVRHDPASPDEMVRLAQPYDAGLACEEDAVLNRRLCLTNKAFTYLAAGVPVILSRTPAQAQLEADLGEAAFGYACGDVDGLARILRQLPGDSALCRRAHCAARAAAERRWHWEHADDRGALLSAVASAIR